MHLRRALLLLAIVLGLAAIAAAVSQPVEDEPAPTTTPRSDTRTSPTLADGSAGLPTAEIAFDAGEPRARRLEVGRAATVSVEVETPGMVAIPGLGVSAAAEPLTPARFDVLTDAAGRYEVEFAPADGDEARKAGTLVVEPGET